MTISGGMTRVGTAGIPATADDRLPEVAIHPHFPVHQALLITEVEIAYHTHALRSHSLPVHVPSIKLEHGPESVDTIRNIEKAGKMIHADIEDEISLLIDTTALHLRVITEGTTESGQGKTGNTLTSFAIAMITLLTGHRLAIGLQPLPIALSQLVPALQHHPLDPARLFLLVPSQEILVPGHPRVHHLLHHPQIRGFPSPLFLLHLRLPNLLLFRHKSKFISRDPMRRRMCILLLHSRCALQSPQRKQWLTESRAESMVLNLILNLNAHLRH